MKRLTLLTVFIVIIAGCTPSVEKDTPKDGPGIGADGQQQAVSAVNDGNDATTGVDDYTNQVVSRYGVTIKRYALQYGFDWRLILAIMRQESRFSSNALSHKGATGLMQIMPVTQEEVTRQLAMDDLEHPRDNIHAGIFYLSRLYKNFEGASEADRIELTLAAYNAGMSRVADAQAVASYIHENPLRWRAVKQALPLLSKRYYTLHRNVWQVDRPRSGWFGNARETVCYVDNIMDYYDGYRRSLN